MTREDITLRPQLEDSEEALARLPRAREAANIARLRLAVRENQIVSRVIRHKAAQRALAAAQQATARSASSSFVGAAAGGASRAVLAGTVGALFVVGAAATVGQYLFDGGTLEELGHDLNGLLLGDTDDQARARGASRDYLGSNPALVAHIGRKGLSPAIEKVARSLASRAELHQKGVSRIMEARGMNTATGGLDMLLVRLRAAFGRGWASAGGDANVAAVRRAMGRQRTSMQ